MFQSSTAAFGLWYTIYSREGRKAKEMFQKESEKRRLQRKGNVGFLRFLFCFCREIYRGNGPLPPVLHHILPLDVRKQQDPHTDVQ